MDKATLIAAENAAEYEYHKFFDMGGNNRRLHKRS